MAGLLTLELGEQGATAALWGLREAGGLHQGAGVLLQLRGLQWGMKVCSRGESQEVNPRKLGSHHGLLSLNANLWCGGHPASATGVSEATHSGCSAEAEPLKCPHLTPPQTPQYTNTDGPCGRSREKAPFLLQGSSGAFFAKVQHCIHCGKEMCKEAKIPLSQSRYENTF